MKVLACKLIRDRMPRSLWELKLDCGHTHYETVDDYPQAPTQVLCRVCQSLARLRAYRRRVIEYLKRASGPGGAGGAVGDPGSPASGPSAGQGTDPLGPPPWGSSPDVGGKQGTLFEV